MTVLSSIEEKEVSAYKGRLRKQTPLPPLLRCIPECDHRDIVEVGAGVTSRQVGERVALEPGVPCWSNRMSRSN